MNARPIDFAYSPVLEEARRSGSSTGFGSKLFYREVTMKTFWTVSFAMATCMMAVAEDSKSAPISILVVGLTGA